MSDPPITPRSPTGLPEATVPMATKPAGTAQPADPAQPATQPLSARAVRAATQMSASAVPTTLESPQGDAPPSAAPSFVTDEISGMSIAQHDAAGAQHDAAGAPRAAGAARHDDPAHAAHAAPPRRIGPATLASPLVPLAPTTDDGAPAPALPPLPPVIDVGAPAHAFVARSLPASPPFGSPAPALPPAMPGMHHGPQGAAPAPAHAPARTSTSTSVMVLVVVGATVALLAIAVAVIAVVVVTRRAPAPSTGPSLSQSQPSPPGYAPGTATQSPRPVRR